MGIRRIALITAMALLALPPVAHAAFPGQNGKIAFEYSQCGATGCTGPNLYDVFEDGTGRTQLTTVGRNIQAAWSADGSKIAFATDRNEPSPPGVCGGHCNWEIYTMNADGTGQTRLTFNSAEDLAPTWSPDGSKIAFNSAQNGIYVMNADGSDQRLLLAGARDPAWSPDGTKIAYTGPGGESDQLNATDIWVMDADGTNQRRITQSGDIEYMCGSDYFTIDEADFGPDWSPDGTRLAYGEFFNDLCLDGDASYAVETVDASGAGSERTIFSAGEGCGFPSAAWSPDGSRIAYTYCYLYGVNPDGSDKRPIDSTCCGISHADWQPIVNHPPDCSTVTADPSLLWPANGTLRPVELSGASDPDGDAVSLEITGVTQDERVRGTRDAYGAAENAVRLRAKRDPRGDGRVYRIAFTATDSKGAQCDGTAAVSVPRHKKQPAVDSAPPSYNSLGR